MNTFILNYTAKSCVINGLNLPLNSLICDVRGDYVGFNYAFAPIIGIDGQVNNVVIPPILYSNYLNGQSANAPFASSAAILTFFDNFLSVGGGGIALAINMPVSGSTVDKILKINSDRTLGQEDYITVYNSDGSLRDNRTIDCDGNKLTIINFSGFSLFEVPSYANDADALIAGLVTGDLYQTTEAESTYVKVVPR